MTDREKRELKAGVISIFNRFNTLDHSATIGGLRDEILRYIDSLQEEPKPKFNKGDKIQSVGKSTGHIYTFTIKEIQDDCYVLDDDKVLTFNMQDSWELVKEPVSEDLEEAANEWDKKAWFSPISMVMDGDRPIGTKQHITSHADSFKAGAQWQRQKDEHLIWQLSSANYEKGIEEGKKQMMKDAFEREVKVDAGGYPYIPQMELYDYDKDIPLAKEGDKYKVILIKED